MTERPTTLRLGSTEEAFRPHGTCTLLVTDIAGSGSLRTRSVQEEVRSGHYGMLEDCLRGSEIRPERCYWEDRGDGIIVAIPPTYRPLTLIFPFLDNLQYWLREHNLNADHWKRIRLRVALHVGEAYHDGRGLTGSDVNLVFRLVEARRLKGAFRDSSASLAFIASDEVYRDVIKTAPRPVDPDVFTAIHVQEKETHATAWIQLRGKADPRESARQDLCPYPGLAPFRLDDVQWFFGRERATSDLLQRLGTRLRGTGPLIVVGPSGVGKSSLLRAGLLHGVKNGNLGVQGSREWSRLLFTPTAAPLTELTAQLAELGVTDLQRRIGGCPAGAVSEPPADGRSMAQDRILIVVDQFEEIFTLCPDERQRQAFIRALCALASGYAGNAPQTLVVLGLRADYLGSCMAYPELVEALRDDPVLLEPMRPAELRDAIERPAHALGLDVESGLVEILLRDLGVTEERVGASEATYEPGALPLLAHALRATWQQCGGRALTFEGYQITGRIRGAIAKTAERAYRRLDSAGQETARRLLLHMVKITEGSETRRQVNRTPLVDESADPRATAAVLDELATARLVTLDETTVEITHDALLREWPLLREWIDADRAGLLIRQRLIDDADTWAHEGKRPSDLYRGPRLADAHAWAVTADHDTDLTTPAREFLEASIACELQEKRTAERRTRRLHQLVVGLAILSVLALGTTTVAVVEQQIAARQRNDALSGQIASEATTLYQSQPELALLLSVQAFRIGQSTESRNSLLSTQDHYYAARLSTGSPAYGVAFRPDDQAIVSAEQDGVDIWNRMSGRRTRAVISGRAVYGVAYGPDGRLLAMACQDGSVMLWDVRDHRHYVLSGPNRHGPANDVAFSPSGAMLASAGYDGIVRLWDVKTRRPSRLFVNDIGPVESVAFSPDGHLLAEAGADQSVVLWDVRSGRRFTLAGHIGPVRAVAFSPDGRLLASGGDDGTVRLWDVVSRTLIDSLSAHTGSVRAVAFSPNGRLLASGGDDASVRLWDVASRRLLTSLTGPTGPVAKVTFSRDGGTLASANADSSIGLWSVGALGGGGPRTVGALGLAADGHPLWAAAGIDNVIQLWDPRSGRLVDTLRGHVTAINALLFSPADRMLAAATDGGVALWDLAAHAGPTVLRGSGVGPVTAVAFSPDERTVAAASGGTLTLWNVLTHRISLTITPHPSQITALAFSPDGRVVATGSDDGTVSLTHVGGSGGAPSGTSSDCSGHVGAVLALAFSQAGDLLASASTDRTVKLWSLAPCKLVHTFTGHTQSAVAVAFSSDGGVLASADEDGLIDLWDVTPHWNASAFEEIAALSGDAGVTSLVFGQKSETLVSVYPDGRPVVWDTDPGRVMDRICQTLPTPPSNWRQYVPPGLPPLCPDPASARRSASHADPASATAHRGWWK